MIDTFQSRKQLDVPWSGIVAEIRISQKFGSIEGRGEFPGLGVEVGRILDQSRVNELLERSGGRAALAR